MTVPLKITILGSGTCVPSLERSSCSVLVAWDGISILCDAGAGTMGRLLEAGQSIDEIDAIVLSHFHLDHAGEVASFLFSTKYPEMRRKKKLTLVGGQGLNPWFEQLCRTFNHTIEMDEDFFECLELEAKGAFRFGELTVSYDTMAHKPESRGFRFETPDGFSAVYSGDTDVTDNLVNLAQGADILICESAMPDGQKLPNHLTPSLAGQMAQKAGVKKLVLTHFYPECEDADLITPCKREYSGPVVLAEDLMQIC